MTTDAAAALDATAAAGRWGTAEPGTWADSIDNAKPTGTTNAATMAASISTRNRLRISSHLFEPRPGFVFGGDRQVDRIAHALRNLQARCHAARTSPRSTQNGSKRPENTANLHARRCAGSRRHRPTDVVARNEFSQVSDTRRRPAPLCYAQPLMSPPPDRLLLSLAVHEFRGHISVVGGYLRMLQRDGELKLNDRQRKMVDEAEKSCGKLAGVINELSDISKLDAGLVKLARQRLDLFALVGEVAELVQEARDRDVRLEVRGDASGAVISGDATRLRQAFDAIFRAIVREKPGPATVIAERRLEARDGVTSAVVVVADESSVQLAYERAAGPFNEKRGGLGLALPLARRVIEGHGGRLWSPEPTDVVPEDGETRDPLARGSAIVSVPVTE